MKLFLPVSGFQDWVENSVGFEQTVGVVRPKLIAPQVGKCKTITFANGQENDFFGTCGRHGFKGLFNARIYQENFVGV
jgi:hypothetical protein